MAEAVTEAKQALFQLLTERQRDIVQRTTAGRTHRKIYAGIVIGILPKHIAEMADRHTNIHNEQDSYAEESEKKIDELLEKLRASIFSMIEGPASA